MRKPCRAVGTRRWWLLLAALALLLPGLAQPAAANPGSLLGSVTVTALDPDGVTPDSVGATTRAIAGSYGNFLAFTYTGGALPGVDSLSIEVPAAWQGSGFGEPFSADEGRYETPGFVRVKPGTCDLDLEQEPPPLAVENAANGSTLTLDGFSCGHGDALSIELFYVTAPDAPGTYAFPTRVGDVPPLAVAEPALEVHPVPNVALVLSSVPQSVVSGEPFDVVVTAVRDNGKVHRGYHGTVRFVGACTDGVDDVTFSPLDHGTRLISGVVLRGSGSRTFGFRDVGNTTRSGEAVTTVSGAEDPPPDGCGVRYH